MEFSYQNLKTAAIHGDRIGSWKGYKVFTCSRKDLDNKAGDVFYILYDDDNRIVCRNSQGEWREYGTVSEEGNVNEYSYSRAYGVAEEKPAAKKKKEEKKKEEKKPVVKEEEPECVKVVDRDYLLDKGVEDTLAAARTMSIDSLLEGFNYGLD